MLIVLRLDVKWYDKNMLEVLLFIIFIGLILYWEPYIMKTTKHGAPFVGMDPDVVPRVMTIAEVKKGDKFYELGSGDGRLVITAAMRGANAVGVEIDSIRVWYSRLWIKLLRLSSHAKILHQNIFDVDLSDADVVCLYLLPETNEKILSKLKKELRPGTRVVSVAFTFPGWKPEKVDPRGTIYGPIYLYII